MAFRFSRAPRTTCRLPSAPNYVGPACKCGFGGRPNLADSEQSRLWWLESHPLDVSSDSVSLNEFRVSLVVPHSDPWTSSGVRRIPMDLLLKGLILSSVDSGEVIQR